MCEASAYLIRDGKETLVLESVDIVEPLDEGGFMLRNIFGDQVIINARIQKMELVNHRILFLKRKLTSRIWSTDHQHDNIIIIYIDKTKDFHCS